MKASKTARMLMAILAVGIVTVWSTGTPALAAPYVVAYHGVDYAMADSGNDVDFWACDGENDFNTMWAEVQTTRFVNKVVFDGIADGTCVRKRLNQPTEGYILYIRACEEDEGCSPWKYVL